MNFFSKSLLLSAGLAISCMHAHEDPLSFYIAAGGGYHSFSATYSGTKYNFDGIVPSIFGGARYQINHHFGLAIAGSTSFSSIDKQNITVGGTTYSLKSKLNLSFEVQPSYFWGYNSRVFGIVGGSSYNLDVSGGNKTKLTTKPHYGLGAEMKLSNELSVIARGLTGKIGDQNVAMVSGGTAYTFQKVDFNSFSLGLAYTL